MAIILRWALSLIKSLFCGIAGVIFCLGKNLALAATALQHHESLADVCPVLFVIALDAVWYATAFLLRNPAFQARIVRLIPASVLELSAQAASMLTPFRYA